MFYYKYLKSNLVSFDKVDMPYLIEIKEEDIGKEEDVFFLYNNEVKKGPLAFIPNCTKDLLIRTDEKIFLIDNSLKVPKSIQDKIIEGKIICINSSYPNWMERLQLKENKSKISINVIGLGDVGSTLVLGLLLLGNDNIATIGLFDIDEKKVERLLMECSQVLDTSSSFKFPHIKKLCKEEIFNCNMFVFAVSTTVPTVNSNIDDVRIIQYDSNKKILKNYINLARNNKFKGIFAIVSDPVEQLCNFALTQSNKNSIGKLDFLGMLPENIIGYGLGVMNGRASYISNTHKKFASFKKDGRVFGAHGEGLFVCNSLSDFDLKLSEELTEITKNINKDIRKLGFKPYIAPAISSGALSIISTLKGEFTYSSVFLNGTYFGCRNKRKFNCVKVEAYDSLNESILNELKKSFNYLNSFAYQF